MWKFYSYNRPNLSQVRLIEIQHIRNINKQDMKIKFLKITILFFKK